MTIGGTVSLSSDWLWQALVVSGTLIFLPGPARLHFVRDGAQPLWRLFAYSNARFRYPDIRLLTGCRFCYLERRGTSGREPDHFEDKNNWLPPRHTHLGPIAIRDVESWGYFPLAAGKTVCTGDGMGMVPLASRHRIALSLSVSAASAWEKSSVADSLAPGAFFWFAW